MHFLKSFCYIIVLASPLSMNASAEENSRTGMAYTTMGYSGAKAKPLTTFQTKQIVPIQDIDAPENTTSEAEKIWGYYKALAAGKSLPSKKKPTVKQTPTLNHTTPKQPIKTHHQVQPKQGTAPPKPSTGFGAILQQYNENKKSRGGMQSRTITTPKKPTRPTPPDKAVIN